MWSTRLYISISDTTKRTHLSKLYQILQETISESARSCAYLKVRLYVVSATVLAFVRHRFKVTCFVKLLDIVV